MSPDSSRFSFATSVTTSPPRSVALLHFGSLRVEDTTYLGRLFSLSAHSPVLAAQRAANHSSVRLPSSRASVPRASSSMIVPHPLRPSPPEARNQPPRPNPSLASGS